MLQGALFDLQALKDIDRFAIFSEIMASNPTVSYTSTNMKEELSARNLYYKTIGVDFRKMRVLDFIEFDGQYSYQWKAGYKGDWEKDLRENHGWSGKRFLTPKEK